MNKWTKIIVYGLLLWIVPFFAGFLFFPIMQADEIFFKTIMIVISTLTGMILIIYYFKNVKKKFIKEAVVVGTSWLLLNWILDLIVLLPMTGQSLDRYFLEIGLRYLNAPLMTTGVGFLLKERKR